MMQKEEIVRRHGPMVWQLVCRIVGGARHEADAADCFQEVFVAALEVDRAARVRNWEALLKRFAVVKGIDVLRRRVRARGREEREPAWEELAGGGTGPESRVEQAELLAQLRAGLATLPELQSTAFALRHISGMSYEEIAREMGATTNAVGVLLTRARARLIELMDDKTCEKRGEL